MTDTIITSAISGLGILISVIASVIITRQQNKIELEKIRRQLEQAYAKSLFDKRVETYPELYKLLSGYLKIIQYNKQNVKNLVKLRDELDKWNNQYGIFFTASTARLSARFRSFLQAVLDQRTGSKIQHKDWDVIRNIIGHFEMSLKSDIGVTSVQAVSRTYLKNGRLWSNLLLGADRWISKTNNGRLSNLYFQKQLVEQKARDARE